jgi:hypothetical protein
MKPWKRLEIVEHPEGGFTVRDTGPGQEAGAFQRNEHHLPAVAFSTLGEVLEYLPTRLGPPRQSSEEQAERRNRGRAIPTPEERTLVVEAQR